MNFRVLKPFLWLSVFILIVGLACGAVSSSPTEAPPTEPPPPTVSLPTELPPTLPLPTEPPPPTEAPTAVPELPTPLPEVDQPAFELDPNPYLHSGGLFGFNPPLGWSIDEDAGSASISAPDDSGFIYMQVTNAGYAFDANAFARFVNAREANFFNGFEAYQEAERSIEGNIATFSKSIVFNNIPQVVLTVYNQREHAIYAFDFWADADKFAAYSPQYLAIVDTLTINSAAAADLDSYLWVYTFDGPAGLFSIEVPTPWEYARDSSDTVIIDTFSAPDKHALIQNISYDDGTQISKSQAASFALALLKQFYADDIKITDDKVQPDGSERLIWNSPSGDYSGISFFESRGTTFLLFTVVWDNPYEDIYLPALQYTISTYDIP